MDLTRSPNRRRVLFGAYYFVEGAPIGFLWWALPAILRADGVGTERIGTLLGWLVLPWALKWVWAPLIDLGQGSRWGLRGWIGAAQVGMALSLAPLHVTGELDGAWLAPCLVAHAVCAATQDAAIDALMVATTPSAERGRLAGWMQAGMLAGRSLLGGGALLVVGRFGERGVVLALLAVVTLGLGLLPLYRSPLVDGERERSARVLARHFRAALAQRTTWLGLAFAATAGAGFEAVGAFAGPLLTERSGATELAGRFFLVHAVIATVAGGLAGGWITDRLGARRGTVLAGLALGATVLASALAIETVEGAHALVPVLSATYVAIGWFTAASYALFMEWTDPRLGATQFSAYMGATNLCESWSASVAGRMIPRVGYGPSFAVLALIGLFALGLTTRRALSGAPTGPTR